MKTRISRRKEHISRSRQRWWRRRWWIWIQSDIFFSFRFFGGFYVCVAEAVDTMSVMCGCGWFETFISRLCCCGSCVGHTKNEKKRKLTRLQEWRIILTKRPSQITLKSNEWAKVMKCMRRIAGKHFLHFGMSMCVVHAHRTNNSRENNRKTIQAAYREMLNANKNVFPFKNVKKKRFPFI